MGPVYVSHSSYAREESGLGQSAYMPSLPKADFSAKVSQSFDDSAYGKGWDSEALYIGEHFRRRIQEARHHVYEVQQPKEVDLSLSVEEKSKYHVDIKFQVDLLKDLAECSRNRSMFERIIDFLKKPRFGEIQFGPIVPWKFGAFDNRTSRGSGGEDNRYEVIEGSGVGAGGAPASRSGEKESPSIFKIIVIAALVLGAGYCAYHCRFQAKDWLVRCLYG